MSQNSNQKVPTQRAVRTYVGSLDSVSGNFTVGGNLTVNGTSTTIDTATLSVEDKNIGIGSVTTPTTSLLMVVDLHSSLVLMVIKNLNGLILVLVLIIGH